MCSVNVTDTQIIADTMKNAKNNDWRDRYCTDYTQIDYSYNFFYYEWTSLTVTRF
jgi:hypothetical protein